LETFKSKTETETRNKKMDVNVTAIPTETSWMTGGINFDLPGISTYL